MSIQIKSKEDFIAWVNITWAFIRSIAQKDASELEPLFIRHGALVSKSQKDRALIELLIVQTWIFSSVFRSETLLLDMVHTHLCKAISEMDPQCKDPLSDIYHRYSEYNALHERDAEYARKGSSAPMPIGLAFAISKHLTPGCKISDFEITLHLKTRIASSFVAVQQIHRENFNVNTVPKIQEKPKGWLSKLLDF
jgi:hypothetical protein